MYWAAEISDVLMLQTTARATVTKKVP